MSKRLNINTDSPFEEQVGYSRAVRVDNIIEVAGTTALWDGEVVGKEDIYEQCMFIFEKIAIALTQAHSSLDHVVRTRIFVTDISRWEDVARAHQETFGEIRPVCTLVEISKLIHPEMLVEIEATAIIPEKGFFERD